VTIGGIHVGGLSPRAAYAVVRAAFNSPLVITAGAHKVEVYPRTLRAVAYAKNAVAHARSARPGTAVPLGVNVNGSSVRKLVARLGKRYDRAAIDSKLLLRNLTPYLTKGEPGKKLQQKESAATIIKALRENKRTGISLPFVEVRQEVSRASFGSIIVIHRGSNRLYLYKGMKPWRTFAVATGQAIYPTPLGKFDIVVKWKDPWWYPPDSPWAKGAKPIPPGPGNPLGTRWMGLSSPGVGIHGTPDPSSLGYSASHGCIRMYIPYAEWLFDHVEVGTPVYIVPA
jgi:lipoprotein-anchoring transpeptidase ErfK/SrfK